MTKAKYFSGYLRVLDDRMMRLIIDILGGRGLAFIREQDQSWIPRLYTHFQVHPLANADDVGKFINFVWVVLIGV